MNERLKMLRKALNLTQQEFADRISIKRNTLATYEGGRNEPIPAVISLICKVFHVNEAWLRTGAGDMFIEQTEDEKIASFIGSIQYHAEGSFQKRFISMLSTLDESEWEVLEKMTEMLFKNKKD